MTGRSASRSGRLLLAAMTALALAFAGAGGPEVARADTAPPAGTPPTVSADGLPTWQINGVVWSQAVVGSTVYATGSFTRARPPGIAPGGVGEVVANNIFAYDINTGARVSSFSHSLNAQGLVVTASPDRSRIYVGGDFTTVDGKTRGHVAAFDAVTGALDASFQPSVAGKVRALTASSSTLFVGGSYGSVNGAARVNLSAVNTSNGALLPWAPPANGEVWSMVLAPDQSRVVVGGTFTTLNGQSASGMGALNATTGLLMPWPANTVIRNGGSKSAITSLRTDGQQIFGSGFAFGTGNFEGTFAADPLTGRITVVNDCHGDTYDVLPTGPALYSVGHAHDCTWIGSFPDTSPRVRWQYALAQTVAPTRTNTGPDNYGWNYNGQPASALLHWFPQLSMGSYTGQYQAGWSLAGNGTYVVLGGEFPAVNGVGQQGLVRLALASSAPNKRGPTYTTKPDTPVRSTNATSPGPGNVTVSFGTAWDYDNATLKYELLRDGSSTAVSTTQIRSNFWTLPTGTLTDTGVPGGSHTYRVRISDPFGNVLLSPTSNPVTVTGTAGNNPPTASFSSVTNALTLSVDGSGSRDPDGTIAGYAWTFGDGARASGAVSSHTYATAGTYDVVLTVTDNAGATNSVTRSVTVSTAAGPFAQDAFSRTTTNGWGSADVGGTWTGAGVTSSFAVSGGVGTIRMGAAGSGPSMTLNGVSSSNTEMRSTIGVDKPATGGGIYVRSSPRIAAGGDRYYADTRYLADGSVTVTLGRSAGGAETSLLAQTVAGLAVVAGDRLNVRVQATGTSPTTLRAKVWKVGAAEPATWNSSVTDSTASLQGAGSIGFRAYLSGSAIDAPVDATFDDLWAGAPG